MAFNFDKIKKGIKEGLETAADKSSKTVEIQKLKTQILSNNSKVKGYYNDLGKIAYDLKDSILSEIDEFKELFEKVNTLLEDNKEKEAQIEQIRAKRDGTKTTETAESEEIVDTVEIVETVEVEEIEED